VLTDACSARALNPYAELKTVCHHRDRGPRSRSSEEVLNKAVQRTLKDGGRGKRRHDAEVVDGVGARETAVFAVVKPLGEDLITTDLMELEIGGDAIEVLGRVDADAPAVGIAPHRLIPNERELAPCTHVKMEVQDTRILMVLCMRKERPEWSSHFPSPCLATVLAKSPDRMVSHYNPVAKMKGT
jgi:hypothetical protein